MADAELTGRTVLVTGGAGFIGSHLAEALVPDNTVRVLDDFSSGERAYVPDGATVIEGDVRDEATVREAMAGVDVVFHEAAIADVDRSVERPAETHSVNVAGTLAVLEAARAADARAVVASSAAVYGDPASVPVHEDDPLAPLSPYGLEKLTVDRYARLYHDLYGLATVALRYFNVYGPRQGGGYYSGVIEIFRQQAAAGEPITVHGDGEQTRDFVHVSDVVTANLLAATTENVGAAYNIATGDAISIRGLAELVQDVTGSESEIVHTEPRTGDIEHSRAAIGRARDGLGFEATVSVRDGLRALVARSP